MLSPKVTGILGVATIGSLAYIGPGAQTQTRRTAVTGAAAAALVVSLIVGFSND